MIMRTIKKSDKVIMAIGDGMLFMFNVAALKQAEIALPMKRYPVGLLINDQCMTETIYAESNYHDMILKAETAVVVSREQYDKLLRNTVALANCIEKVDHLHTKLFGKVEEDADSNKKG